jgi:hypothetical protein
MVKLSFMSFMWLFWTFDASHGLHHKKKKIGAGQEEGEDREWDEDVVEKKIVPLN